MGSSTTGNGSHKSQQSKKRSYEPKNTLYVSNLNTKIDVRRLRENLFLLFSIYGEVLKVSINFKTERGRAFVTMRTADEANLALLSLNSEPFFGQPLNIDFSKKDTQGL